MSLSGMEGIFYRSAMGWNGRALKHIIFDLT